MKVFPWGVWACILVLETGLILLLWMAYARLSQWQKTFPRWQTQALKGLRQALIEIRGGNRLLGQAEPTLLRLLDRQMMGGWAGRSVLMTFLKKLAQYSR